MLPTVEPYIVVHVRGVQANETPRRFIHDRHHLSVVLRGTGLYFNGPCELPARPCMSFNPAGHNDVNGFVGPVEAWYVGFDWPGVWFEAEGLGGLRVSSTPVGAGATVRESISFLAARVKAVDSATAALMVERFSALQASTSRQDAVGRLEAAGRLMQLVADFFELPVAETSHGHRALALFHDLLVERACDPVTIEDLAAEAGVTADHLRDLFRARYGLRPVEFRTGVRLSRARDLLTSTIRNVGEVARTVGYPDPLYFSRVFRKHFGFTPSDLIKRYRLPG